MNRDLSHEQWFSPFSAASFTSRVLERIFMASCLASANDGLLYSCLRRDTAAWKQTSNYYWVEPEDSKPPLRSIECETPLQVCNTIWIFDNYLEIDEVLQRRDTWDTSKRQCSWSTVKMNGSSSNLMIVADAGGLPSSVVSGGIGLVELEAVVLVPAHVEERHTKRALA